MAAVQPHIEITKFSLKKFKYKPLVRRGIVDSSCILYRWNEVDLSRRWFGFGFGYPREYWSNQYGASSAATGRGFTDATTALAGGASRHGFEQRWIEWLFMRSIRICKAATIGRAGRAAADDVPGFRSSFAPPRGAATGRGFTDATTTLAGGASRHGFEQRRIVWPVHAIELHL
jgi:hypothetical protein